jgi:hypothetical protein
MVASTAVYFHRIESLAGKVEGTLVLPIGAGGS